MKKKAPRERMKRRRDRFVVGYLGAKNIVFGNPASDGIPWTDACAPHTRLQAERLLAQMPCDDCAIYELVPVQTNEPRRK